MDTPRLKTIKRERCIFIQPKGQKGYRQVWSWAVFYKPLYKKYTWSKLQMIKDFKLPTNLKHHAILVEFWIVFLVDVFFLQESCISSRQSSNTSSTQTLTLISDNNNADSVGKFNASHNWATTTLEKILLHKGSSRSSTKKPCAIRLRFVFNYRNDDSAGSFCE